MPRFGKTQNEVDALEVWKDKQRKKRKGESDIWSFKPGTLTIVDLSDPLSDEYAACTLFDICLGLFMENQSAGGTILALDEAHKVNISPFVTTSPSMLTHSSSCQKAKLRQLSPRVCSR